MGTPPWSLRGAPRRARGIALAAALLFVSLTLSVANAGGRPFAVSPITVQVIGKGTVTSSPAAMNCGGGATVCQVAFSTGGTLTATPAAGWAFDTWTNCPTAPAANACDVPADGNRYEVTANFTGPPTTLSTLSVTYTGDGNVSGGGIDCGSSPAGTVCTRTVLTGSTLTVGEAPAPANVFTGWGGACSGGNVACTVELGGDRSVGAAWASAEAVLLTVGVSGLGTVTGGGVSCPLTCAASHPVNSTVVLTAAAVAGNRFTGWGGACSGTGPTCSVLMDAAQSVTATFVEVVELTVTVTGSGNVSGEGGAINCGNGANVCSASFPLNEAVVLSATPATGSTFTGWRDACGGATSSCTVLMSVSKSVSATFSAGAGATVPLTVSVSGPGTVTGPGINCGGGGSACTASPATGSSVTLTAAPTAGATFAGWGGACTGTITTCSVPMNVARTVSATFTAPPPVTVALVVTVTGRGTVIGGGINCGNGATGCRSTLTQNSTVTLTATPASGATFTGWGGPCSGRGATCTLTMTEARDVSATFQGAAPRTLTIRVVGRGSVQSSVGPCVGRGPRTTCTRSVPAGRRVVLTAKPAAGMRFRGWSGACRGTRTTCSLTLSAARTVTATFVRRSAS